MDRRFPEHAELKSYIKQNCFSVGKIINKLGISSNAWYAKIWGVSLFWESEKKLMQGIFGCTDEEMDRLVPLTWETHKKKQKEQG